MIVLQASHIQKHFDGEDVLVDASVVIQERDRVGLIGHNGAGKSTLLRIVCGELNSDRGEIHLSREANLGYVSQFVVADEQQTVYEFMAETFHHVRQMEEKLRRLEKSMADPDVYENERKFTEVSERYAALQQSFEDAGGYGVDAEIRRVLYGLNFPPEMQHQPVGTLSGGQKTRLSLARLLASKPSVLVLDEPTNYLDTSTLTWLEQYLQTYSGAVLVVSHDRYFLDQIATQIVELDSGRTTSYQGNYSQYIVEKSLRLELEEKHYEQQQAEIKRLEDFVQKNIVRASTTKRAQSRRKMLMRIERIERPTGDSSQMSLNFHAGRPSGRDVLKIDHLSIGYANRVLAENLSLFVERGMRIALVGPNGIGKSTFLKTVLGQLPAPRGQISIGQKVDIGYYDQEQADLDPTKTVLDQLWDEHRSMDVTAVRTALGRFLFRQEEVQKPVAGLSGGERSRLNLCRLMLQDANTLIMDEPTNHLDLLSKEVLEDALAEFDGTLLFVSHDRYFIDAIATHVAVLGPNGFELYIGNYTDYRRKVEDAEKWDEEVLHDSPRAGTENLPETALASSRRRIRSSDVRRLKERVETCEGAIADNESRQEAIAFELNEAALNQEVNKTRELQEELTELLLKHEFLLKEWEDALLELEELEDLINEN